MMPLVTIVVPFKIIFFFLYNLSETIKFTRVKFWFNFLKSWLCINYSWNKWPKFHINYVALSITLLPSLWTIYIVYITFISLYQYLSLCLWFCNFNQYLLFVLSAISLLSKCIYLNTCLLLGLKHANYSFLHALEHFYFLGQNTPDR